MIRSAEMYVAANPTVSDTTFPYNTTDFKMEKNKMITGSLIYTESTGTISVDGISDGIFCAKGTKKDLQIYEGERC